MAIMIIIDADDSSNKHWEKLSETLVQEASKTLDNIRTIYVKDVSQGHDIALPKEPDSFTPGPMEVKEDDRWWW